MMGYKVGQPLWFKYDGYSSRSGVDQEVAITKIGRSWIYLNNGHRVDKETLIADGKGYSSPGKCYLSRMEYEYEKAINKEWSSLRRILDVYYKPPRCVTKESIQQARELLGLYSTESP
jgi:hypothetical protein